MPKKSLIELIELTERLLLEEDKPDFDAEWLIQQLPKETLQKEKLKRKFKWQ